MKKEKTEITYTNLLKTETGTINLEEMSKSRQVEIANYFIYKPLTTLTGVEVVETA